MELPMQEHRYGGENQRGPVSRRNIVSIYMDQASGGSSNPLYTKTLAENVRAEILQVSGGEVIRGRQVEAIVTFIVSCRYIPRLAVNARCKVIVGSGVYKGRELFTHRIHYTDGRSRAKFMDMHCKDIEE